MAALILSVLRGFVKKDLKKLFTLSKLRFLKHCYLDLSGLAYFAPAIIEETLPKL